jgi:VIT1/CCC1 family predicted Fe2+/Mn2+ transporter
MKESFKVGFSFGTTSGVITTLGLMVGLHSGTQSKLAVIGGVLVIAIADAFSDALGMHISEESKEPRSIKNIWEATFSTFFAKLIIASTFAIPVILLPLNTAMIMGIAWGLLLLGVLSYIIARAHEISPWGVIGEHLFIAVVVVFVTHYLGDLVRVLFG